ETLIINGNQVFVTSVIPSELLGTYLYERKGEPIVQLNADNSGIFQPHSPDKIPIKYWLKTDADGNFEKQVNAQTGSYQLTLVMQYQVTYHPAYPAGGFAMAYLQWNAVTNCYTIYGERYKCHQ